jgi:acyl-CoA thioester hydrolase
MSASGPVFKHVTQVYYDLTDAAGVVYHSEYLTLMARARTDALKDCGFSVAVLAESGVLFVVRRAQLEFIKPALFGDQLEVISRVTFSSKVRMQWHQSVQQQDTQTVYCQGDIEIICVNDAFKPMACPSDIMQPLS